VLGRNKKQIPKGNDRKKGKGKDFDAKGAKFATFRHGTEATAWATAGISPLAHHNGKSVMLRSR
jgi:hypothetical protein